MLGSTGFSFLSSNNCLEDMRGDHQKFFVLYSVAELYRVMYTCLFGQFFYRLVLVLA